LHFHSSVNDLVQVVKRLQIPGAIFVQGLPIGDHSEDAPDDAIKDARGRGRNDAKHLQK
jgi:hypothetical protein